MESSTSLPAAERRASAVSPANVKIDDVLEALASVLGPSGGEAIPLHEPQLDGEEQAYVRDCLASTWISSEGAFVTRFEEQLASYMGGARVVATVNGTAAVHVSLLLAGVEPEDEVLLPTLTFVASANAVRYCGAVPHFVDSEISTLGIDAGKLSRHLEAIAVRRNGVPVNRRTGRRLRAVLAVHTLGHPVDLDPLLEVCRRFDLELVEDACEALGSRYKGRHVGTLGRVASLSFNGNKVITTGGGGAVVSTDPDLAGLARHLTTTARVSHPWQYHHDRLGFNYRLPSINAAIGCAQLERLPAFLEQKRRLARRYHEALAPVAGVRSFTEPEFAASNYWLCALLLDGRFRGQRDELLEGCHRAGVLARPLWRLMHQLPMFASSPRMDLGVAEDLESRLVCLPSSARLGARLPAAERGGPSPAR